MFHRLFNELLVELKDAVADTIPKVIPGSSGGSIAAAKPLHGFIELRFFEPHRLGRFRDPSGLVPLGE